jgi:hypothetical protein
MEDELDTLNCDGAANEFDGNEEIALEPPYEIIQSVLRSAKAQGHSLREHGNLTYLPSYWLHEGKFARKIAQVQPLDMVDNSISLCELISAGFSSRDCTGRIFHPVGLGACTCFHFHKAATCHFTVCLLATCTLK